MLGERFRGNCVCRDILQLAQLQPAVIIVGVIMALQHIGLAPRFLKFIVVLHIINSDDGCSMNFPAFDMNLLKVLSGLYEERS